MDTIKTLMTEKPTSPENGSVIITTGSLSNVEVVTMTWYSQVGVRAIRVFIQNVIWHLLSAGVGAKAAIAALDVYAQATGVDVPMPIGTLFTIIVSACTASLGPTLMCVLQNTLELLGGVDTKNPSFRA